MRHLFDRPVSNILFVHKYKILLKRNSLGKNHTATSYSILKYHERAKDFICLAGQRSVREKVPGQVRTVTGHCTVTSLKDFNSTKLVTGNMLLPLRHSLHPKEEWRLRKK